MEKARIKLFNKNLRNNKHIEDSRLFIEEVY